MPEKIDSENSGLELEKGDSELVSPADFGLEVKSPYADEIWMRKKYNLEKLFDGNTDLKITRIFAKRLASANKILAEKNLKILIWDGCRSVENQKKLFAWAEKNLTGNPEDFVARPGESEHNFGLAVDITLTTLDGQPVKKMPSEFDDFQLAFATPPRSGIKPLAWSQKAFENWQILNEAAEAAGLVVHPNEWWHFTLAEYRDADDPQKFREENGFKLIA